MSTYKGIDCASEISATAAKQIKASGYDFVCRYLVPPTMAWKDLTAQEARNICDAGLKILCVFEATADRVKGGAAAGTNDGLTARMLAEAMGMPITAYIYFAVDYEAPASDIAMIDAYLRAARAQTGTYEIGVYGPYSVIEAIATRGACKGFWQCFAWSYGKVSDHRMVYQYKAGQTVAGIAVDLDEAYSLDGLWTYNTESEREKMIRYNTIADVPDWGKPTVQKLIDAGALKGTKDGLNLSEDMLRILVINDRMGLYR